jgi:hypothetical protein
MLSDSAMKPQHQNPTFLQQRSIRLHARLLVILVRDDIDLLEVAAHRSPL